MAKRLLSDDERFEALKRNRWNQQNTANELGVHVRTVACWAANLRGKGYRVGQAAQALASPPPPPPPSEPAPTEPIKTLLRRHPASLEEISTHLSVSRGQVLDAIDQLRDAGLNIHEHSGKFTWAKTPTPGHVRQDLPEIVADADGWIRLGFTSDQHLCSKYARLDVLNDLYDRFADAGVAVVLNGGNWIDGEFRFNMHDLLVHGLDPQLDYLVEHYPRRAGIRTLAVTGDDHEGWYAQREGVDVGRMAQGRMEAAGRDDWTDLGYMEAFLRLVHPASGKHSMAHLMHPGGGTAYAESYTVQKIVEGYDGGEKPAVLFAGHYHKLSYNLIRNVHCIQTGCTQDQTPFARKKKIRFALGGGVAELKLDPDTGAITRCRVEIFNYFVRDYYNHRWSHAGPVTLPDRGAAA